MEEKCRMERIKFCGGSRWRRVGGFGGIGGRFRRLYIWVSRFFGNRYLRF